MLLKIEDLTASFGKKPVFGPLTHSFCSGVTCIRGASGSGKTTLLRIIMGLQSPHSGRVYLEEGARISAMFQENRLCENLSAAANIRLVTPQIPQELLWKMLRRVGLEQATEQPVKAFSGGMKRRVAFLRALLFDFDLLLLDEPFTGIDNQAREQMLALIMEYSEGKTVLIATHDDGMAEALSAEVLWVSGTL